MSVGGVFFGNVGTEEGDQQGRGGVGFSRAFEGRDLEAVGEAEVGDLESAGEAECVEVFPRLCGGDGDACQVRGVGDGTGPGVRFEVGVLLNPDFSVVIGEPVEADVELALELAGFLLGGDAELVESVVFVRCHGIDGKG